MKVAGAGIAEPLRGKETSCGAWYGTLDEKQVGFLARLNDAEFGVESSAGRNKPIGIGERSPLRRCYCRPRRPALIDVGLE